MSTAIVELTNKYKKAVKGIEYNFRGILAIPLNICYNETKRVTVDLPSNFQPSNYSLLWANYWTIYFEDTSASPVQVKQIGEIIHIEISNNNLVWNMHTK